MLTLLSLLTAGFSAALQARPTVTGARVGQYEDATRFVLDLSENVAFRIYTLADPYRLVVDLLGAGWALDDKQLTLNRGLVGALRYGQFQTETARIVVDLRAPATVNQAFILAPGKSAYYRLVIDLGQVAGRAFRPSTLSSVEAIEPAASRRQPPPQSGTEQTTEQTVRTANVAANVAPRIPPPPPPRPRQLVRATSKPLLIFIDPGHGGADPGAVSGNGIFEKDVTLAAAKALEITLIELGYDVVLSRRRDKYLSLSARAEKAQSLNADLFISLHADKHENRKIRGASVYTLSEKASDAETEALAARENEADSLFDVSNSEEYAEDVRKILISLVQRSTMTCSAKFAGELIPQLKKSTKLLGRTHRFAGFRVLKAPNVPSVLVEMGYMSNGKDRKMLLSEAGRYALMRRVAEAIEGFFSRHESCSQAS
ncbi:MAG: N-acetylmuramoyl-L-alanine amidase [Alphaproteobacteria bacterium]|jgi:N-acetylmuramoyl-L-alanine amidase|nr:N-acetylmuramoyl-L-alanine amidase [Alphaproteobacteria bacterium]